TAPKSNTAYEAIAKASEDIKLGKGDTIPKHLEAPLFKGYVYPHSFPNDWCEQQYLPDDSKNAKYYTFGENKTEQAAKAYWEAVKGKKL
ncbi:MAG: replication-associated recombination protein A, partial [Clostridia bacterium]|nr:replication-associated recombination protein A [Clostridia bacterium]